MQERYGERITGNKAEVEGVADSCKEDGFGQDTLEEFKREIC